MNEIWFVGAANFGKTYIYLLNCFLKVGAVMTWNIENEFVFQEMVGISFSFK